MRIRYGKPVKVKSLLGRCNIPFSITAVSAGWGVASKTDSSFKENWPSNLYSATDTVKVDIIANHIYFAFYSITSQQKYSYARNCPKLYFSDETVVFGNENQNKYYSDVGFCCSILEPTISGSALLHIQNYNNFWTIGDTINYAFIIDITAIYESSMIAEQFYNKYKNKFESLATGQEVLLDNGSGKISYSEKIVLKSLWGDQSNLTTAEATEPGEYIYLGKGGYSTQSTYNVNTNLEDFNTPILNGHKYILVTYTDAYAAFHMFSTLGEDKWKWTDVAGDFIPNQLKYSYYTATEDIILKNFYQGGSNTPTLTKDFFIDLTSTFGVGNEPTAQEFYARYKGYFLDLTTGKEITLGIGKIAGGSSDIYYGYNQLCENGDFSDDTGWKANGSTTEFTITNNECICTPKGDTYPGIAITFNNYKLNHKILYILDVWADENNVGKALCINNGTGLNGSLGSLKLGWNTYSIITTLNADKEYASTAFFTYNPALYAIKFKNIMAIDLTDWYGPGKEPTTVEEFREKFTKEYYPYWPTSIKMTQKQIEEPWYGYNQLIKNGNFVDASNWNTTAGADLAIENNTAILTATSLGTHDFAVSQNIGDLNANDKYIILFDAKTNSTATKMLNMYLSAGYVSETTITLLPTVWNSIGKIFSYETSKTAVTAYFGKIATLSGYWANGDVIYFKNINIINLTEWYGPGNEPTTVEEFRTAFPNQYYPYSQKQVLKRPMINKKVLN